MILIQTKAPVNMSVAPYIPLELAGPDIYIREGCYNCHSQQVRPIYEETLRYGSVSRAHEYMHDHPFQWGSKRTGPDLHRVGGKYPELWHFRHFQDPQTTSPKSIMPPYPWLLKDQLDTRDIKGRMKVLKQMGVPYTQEDIDEALNSVKRQSSEIAGRLKEQGGIEGIEDREVIAMIAHLQRLGKDRINDDGSSPMSSGGGR